VYWIAWYQFGLFASDAERLDARVAVIQSFSPSKMALMSASDLDFELWRISRDAVHVTKGREIFDSICAACHGRDLTARLNGIPLPGLPLHDKEWKHGSKASDIFKIVSKGAPDISKGMVAWEPQLGASKVMDVVAYILSHHEPPQGLLDVPTDTNPATPTTAARQ
jgi:cytochrome c oxidase cbb3-type subunit 3